MVQLPKIFIEHFFDSLRRSRVSGLVLRQYRHERGRMEDDPNKCVRLFPVELSATPEKALQIIHMGRAQNAVALTSLVRVGPRLQRLLLLDFDIPKSHDHELLVRSALKRIKNEHPTIFLNGALLCTNNSYHYVGLTPLSMRSWQRGMGASLLMNQRGVSLIDVRHIGHSLVRGYGALRLLDANAVATSSLLVYI